MALNWYFRVDWGDDGSFSYGNEATHMTGLRTDRGRDYYLTANSNGFEPLSIGRATITLSNHDGRYNPYNAAGPLYGKIDIGKIAYITVHTPTSYPVFVGVVREIEQRGYNDTVTITLEDGFTWLSQEITTDIYQNVQGDDIVGVILDAKKWPSIWGRDLGNGSDNYPYWWADGGNALDEISKVLNSELATFFVKADGKFYYRNRQAAQATVMTLAESNLLKDVRVPMPWHFHKNIVKFTANVFSKDITPTSLWTATGDIVFGAGETKTIIFELSSPAVSMAVTFTSTTAPGGAGTPSSADITFVFVSQTAKTATYTATNAAAYINYVSDLTVTGLGITSTPVSSTANGTGYTTSPRSLAVDLPWQQNPNAPADFSSQMLAFLNTSAPFPVVQYEAWDAAQFIPELFDRVTLDLSTIGINTDFRVGKISHEWLSETGQAVRTTISLEPYRTYSYWLFDSNAILNTSLLGW